MALFRKFFYRKPPDGLLEIVERVYVFDYCFTTEVVEQQNYKAYIDGIVDQLCAHLPDSSFMVFNFREGEKQSQIGDILQECEMTVIDYPRQYEGCPLLPMEMIHHCLKSGESWLSLGQNNVLLMHCEIGGWPILAFMLAALLIYRKLYSGEQRTLDMIYKQAPRELLQLISPLNPVPSQLRYLQYVSRRNLGSEWPPSDRELTLDCLMLRLIPNLDGEGGCRPIVRLYGRDPCCDDRTTKVLFSTPKKSRNVRYFKQGECELVKIDVHRHIQGDVVFECISLDDDLEREEMIFRVMFSTAFIRSNILMLNRDEIDILWNAKDQFPRDFRAEILFSEPESTTCDAPVSMPATEEKEGLPVEAFARVREIFNSVDWDSNSEVSPNVLQQIITSQILKENLKISTHQIAEISILQGLSPGKPDELPRSLLLGNSMKNSPYGDSEKQSEQSEAILDENLFAQKTNNNKENASSIALDNREAANQTAESGSLGVSSPRQLKQDNAKVLDGIVASAPLVSQKQLTPSSGPLDAGVTRRKAQSEDWLPGLQQPSQSKIISPRVRPSPLSISGSYSNSPLSSPMAVQKFHGSQSSIGITALLRDDDTYKGDVVAYLVKSSPKSPATLVSSAPDAPKPGQQYALSSSAPPAAPPSASSRHAASQNTELPVIENVRPDPPPQLPSSQSSTLKSKNDSTPASGTVHLGPCFPPFSHSSPPIAKKSLAAPPPLFGQPPFPSSKESLSAPPSPPHPPPSLGDSPSPCVGSTLPAPPPPPSPPDASMQFSASNDKSSLYTPHPPPPTPPPPPLAGIVPSGTDTLASTPRTGAGTRPLPPYPPPNLSASTVSHSVSASVPPPPPPPPAVAPPPPPPPAAAPPPPPPPPAAARPPPPPPSSAAVPPPSPPSPAAVPPPPLPPSPPPLAVAPPPPPPPASAPSPPTSPATTQPPPPPPASAPPPPPGRKAPPPPPAPFVKGLANVSSQTAGSNGPVPLPPGPLGSKGRPTPRLTRSQGHSKRTNLKPYHWLKLTRVMQGSLWAEAQKSDEAVKAPDFDFSELENLFAASVSNSEKGGKQGKSGRRASGPKSDKVQLIELRRAYNCEIMLSKVKIPLPDLMNSVLALDDSALDADQVENLIKFCPTKEEMELLKGYKGDKENLGKCEQFFLELMKVPRVESKLRVFAFRIQFNTQVSDLRNNLNTVNCTSDEIRTSTKLKRIMQTILSLGNALNHGTARGSAVGFRLDSLLKLTDTRARNNKMTLMHYLCKVLAEKMPELLDFSDDLTSLEAASKIQLKFLAEEMQAISKGLEKVVQECSASGNDGAVSEQFCKILKEFLGYAEDEVKSLALLYSIVGRNADALAMYFGEDPAKCPFEQVVSTMLNFVRMFNKAHQENCKQIEFEKKKAEKEAELERLKMSKDSEQQVRSPNKFGTVN